MGEPTGSWSILPKPLGVWPRFRFSLRVSLGKISSSCISSAIRAQPPGRRSRRRSDAGRVRSRRCAPLRRCRLVDRESRLRAARSDLSAPYQRVHYEDVTRAPCDAMRDMFAKILPGMAWPADGIGISDTRHQLYGNRMRRGNLSLGEVREDAGWQRGHARWRSRDRLAAHSTAPLALWLCAREDSRSSR